MRTLHVSILLLSTTLILNATITLDELVTMALKKSPDINVSQLDFDAASQRVKSAQSYYLPSLDLDFGAGYGGSEFKNQDSLDNTILTGTISASQLIYDFGKTGGKIDSAISDANSSQSILKQVISNKIFEVKNAFYQLLQNRSLLLVHTENVDLTEQQLVRSKRYFDAGIRTKIDVTDAKVNLINAKLSLQNNLYDIKLSRVTLEKAVGVNSHNNFGEVYQKKLDFKNIFESLPTIDLDIQQAEDFAFTHRYELKAYYEQIESAKSQLRSIKADYYPALYASADYTTQNIDDSQQFTPQQQYKAVLNARWNLFSGFRTDAQNQEAKIALLRAKALLDSAKLQIREEVDNAFIYLFKSRDALKLSQSLSTAAEEKHIQAEQRYEHGLSDYIELQQSRQEYVDSLATLVVSYYDYFRSIASLDRSIGK